jgi:hypothetical protein
LKQKRGQNVIKRSEVVFIKTLALQIPSNHNQKIDDVEYDKDDGLTWNVSDLWLKAKEFFA